MDSTPSIVLLLLFAIWSTHHVHCQPNSFKVTDFGAKGDGTTNNTLAFLETWNKACQSNEGMLVVPAGNFLVSEVEFKGPCFGQTMVSIDGIVLAYPNVSSTSLDYWLKFKGVHGLAISGSGTLDGNGFDFWQENKHNFTVRSLKLDHVSQGSIENIHSLNSKKFHIGINDCDGVSIKNITVTAPEDSPNTDGIHLANCSNVNITESNIGTGDDCISMGDGNTNIIITNITCGPGHGISIGSIGKYRDEQEVRTVRVSDCTFIHTMNGARIKTYAPSYNNTVSDVTFTNLIMKNVSNPIVIDQYYCNGETCPPGESNVLVRGVTFDGVWGTSSKVNSTVKIYCSKNSLYGCRDIRLKGVSLTYFKGGETFANCSKNAIPPNVVLDTEGGPQVPASCEPKH